MSKSDMEIIEAYATDAEGRTVVLDPKELERALATREARRAAPEAVREVDAAIETARDALRFLFVERSRHNFTPEEWDAFNLPVWAALDKAAKFLSLLPDAAEARPSRPAFPNGRNISSPSLRESAEELRRLVNRRPDDLNPDMHEEPNHWLVVLCRAAGKLDAVCDDRGDAPPDRLPDSARAATPAPASPVEKGPVAQSYDACRADIARVEQAIKTCATHAATVHEATDPEKIAATLWNAIQPHLMTLAGYKHLRAHPPAGTAAEGWRTMESALDIEPNILSFNTTGPEPSLREIVLKYYINGGFTAPEAGRLRDRYFSSLAATAAPRSPRTEEA